MTETKEIRPPAADAEITKNYHPVALKAVLAAALMIKRPVAGEKVKKAA